MVVSKDSLDQMLDFGPNMFYGAALLLSLSVNLSAFAVLCVYQL